MDLGADDDCAPGDGVRADEMPNESGGGASDKWVGASVVGGNRALSPASWAAAECSVNV